MFCRTVGIGCLLFASACITSPSFHPLDSEPSGGAVGHAEEMALIPEVTLSGPGLRPTGLAKGKGKEKGNCHGKGDEDCDDVEDGSSSGGTEGTPANAAVVVPSFRIDLRETSVREYGDCVSAGACTAAGAGAGCTAPAGLEEHPVSCVTRAQAAAFCAWRQKRLVRYDEWSAAAAGSAARPFPWGTERPSSERLNACGPECNASGMYVTTDGFASTAPTGSFPAGRSPEGVLDLAGNVAEWVDAAVVRGGSYADVDPASVGALSARDVSPVVSEPTIGFRCARDP